MCDLCYVNKTKLFNHTNIILDLENAHTIDPVMIPMPVAGVWAFTQANMIFV